MIAKQKLLANGLANSNNNHDNFNESAHDTNKNETTRKTTEFNHPSDPLSKTNAIRAPTKHHYIGSTQSAAKPSNNLEAAIAKLPKGKF